MTGAGVQRVALDAPHVCLKMMRVNSTETGGSSFSLFLYHRSQGIRMRIFQKYSQDATEEEQR